jgi:hypothetical protein
MAVVAVPARAEQHQAAPRVAETVGPTQLQLYFITTSSLLIIAEYRLSRNNRGRINPHIDALLALRDRPDLENAVLEAGSRSRSPRTSGTAFKFRSRILP